MRYNKCSIPESGVDVNLLERNFFEKYREVGIMSTRQINLPYDYSREFITINSEIGNEIDKGFELFWTREFRENYPILSKRISKKHNYNYITQLLECIKAREINVRIQQHLDLGRKVVIFHNYNNSLPKHPFQIDIEELLEKKEYYNSDLETEIMSFKIEYSHYWNLDLNDLINVRQSIKKHFPNALEFNGTINKKKRDLFVREFNDDKSDANIIIVQVKAGQ